MVDTAGAILGLNTNTDFVGDAQQAALRGVDIRKAQGGLSALNGVDLTDPTSVGNAINNSIKSGNIDQASALAGLNFQQQQRGTLPVFMSLFKDMTGGPGGQPSATATSNAQQTPTVQQQAGHAAETLDIAANTIEQIKSLPPEQRQAALEHAKEQFAARGVPTEAIDSAAQYVLSAPDKTTQDARLDELSSHYQDHSQHLTAVANGQEVPNQPPAAPHSTSGSWFNNFIHDPRFPQLEALASGLKGVGYDVTPMLETAKSLGLPEVQKEAEVANARAIEAEKQAGQVPGELAKHLGEHQIDLAFMDADALAAAKKAGAVATAEEQAKNPNEFVTVEGPDGANHVVRKDFALSRAGEGGGLLTSGISPAEKDFQTSQAKAAAEVLTPDNNAKVSSQTTLDNSQRALSILDKLQTNNLTTYKKALADNLRTIGYKDAEKYSTDVTGYEQLANQALTSGARQAFPQRVTDRDIKLLQSVYPTISTPKDQARIVFGMQAATAQRALDYENFKAEYKGQHTPQAIQDAWNKTQGNRSNFQSPVWANVQIGGRAAFNPATDVKIIGGKKIGAWGLGTGHPVYFEVQ